MSDCEGAEGPEPCTSPNHERHNFRSFDNPAAGLSVSFSIGQLGLRHMTPAKGQHGQEQFYTPYSNKFGAASELSERFYTPDGTLHSVQSKARQPDTVQKQNVSVHAIADDGDVLDVPPPDSSKESSSFPVDSKAATPPKALTPLTPAACGDVDAMDIDEAPLVPQPAADAVVSEQGIQLNFSEADVGNCSSAPKQPADACAAPAEDTAPASGAEPSPGDSFITQNMQPSIASSTARPSLSLTGALPQDSAPGLEPAASEHSPVATAAHEPAPETTPSSEAAPPAAELPAEQEQLEEGGGETGAGVEAAEASLHSNVKQLEEAQPGMPGDTCFASGTATTPRSPGAERTGTWTPVKLNTPGCSAAAKPAASAPRVPPLPRGTPASVSKPASAKPAASNPGNATPCSQAQLPGILSAGKQSNGAVTPRGTAQRSASGPSPSRRVGASAGAASAKPPNAGSVESATQGAAENASGTPFFLRRVRPVPMDMSPGTPFSTMKVPSAKQRPVTQRSEAPGGGAVAATTAPSPGGGGAAAVITRRASAPQQQAAPSSPRPGSNAASIKPTGNGPRHDAGTAQAAGTAAGRAGVGAGAAQPRRHSATGNPSKPAAIGKPAGPAPAKIAAAATRVAAAVAATAKPPAAGAAVAKADIAKDARASGKDEAGRRPSVAGGQPASKDDGGRRPSAAGVQPTGKDDAGRRPSAAGVQPTGKDDAGRRPSVAGGQPASKDETGRRPSVTGAQPAARPARQDGSKTVAAAEARVILTRKSIVVRAGNGGVAAARYGRVVAQPTANVAKVNDAEAQAQPDSPLQLPPSKRHSIGTMSPSKRPKLLDGQDAAQAAGPAQCSSALDKPSGPSPSCVRRHTLGAVSAGQPAPDAAVMSGHAAAAQDLLNTSSNNDESLLQGLAELTVATSPVTTPKSRSRNSHVAADMVPLLQQPVHARTPGVSSAAKTAGVTPGSAAKAGGATPGSAAKVPHASGPSRQGTPTPEALNPHHLPSSAKKGPALPEQLSDDKASQLDQQPTSSAEPADGRGGTVSDSQHLGVPAAVPAASTKPASIQADAAATAPGAKGGAGLASKKPGPVNKAPAAGTAAAHGAGKGLPAKAAAAARGGAPQQPSRAAPGAGHAAKKEPVAAAKRGEATAMPLSPRGIAAGSAGPSKALAPDANAAAVHGREAATQGLSEDAAESEAAGASDSGAAPVVTGARPSDARGSGRAAIAQKAHAGRPGVRPATATAQAHGSKPGAGAAAGTERRKQYAAYLARFAPAAQKAQPAAETDEATHSSDGGAADADATAAKMPSMQASGRNAGSDPAGGPAAKPAPAGVGAMRPQAAASKAGMRPDPRAARQVAATATRPAALPQRGKPGTMASKPAAHTVVPVVGARKAAVAAGPTGGQAAAAGGRACRKQPDAPADQAEKVPDETEVAPAPQMDAAPEDVQVDAEHHRSAAVNSPSAAAPPADGAADEAEAEAADGAEAKAGEEAGVDGGAKEATEPLDAAADPEATPRRPDLSWLVDASPYQSLAAGAGAPMSVDPKAGFGFAFGGGFDVGASVDVGASLDVGGCPSPGPFGPQTGFGAGSSTLVDPPPFGGNSTFGGASPFGGSAPSPMDVQGATIPFFSPIPAGEAANQQPTPELFAQRPPLPPAAAGGSFGGAPPSTQTAGSFGMNLTPGPGFGFPIQPVSNGVTFKPSGPNAGTPVLFGPNKLRFSWDPANGTTPPPPGALYATPGMGLSSMTGMGGAAGAPATAAAEATPTSMAAPGSNGGFGFARGAGGDASDGASAGGSSGGFGFGSSFGGTADSASVGGSNGGFGFGSSGGAENPFAGGSSGGFGFGGSLGGGVAAGGFGLHALGADCGEPEGSALGEIPVPLGQCTSPRLGATFGGGMALGAAFDGSGVGFGGSGAGQAVLGDSLDALRLSSISTWEVMRNKGVRPVTGDQ